MTHLTHTGYYAGTPFCSVNRSEALERGERFIHPPYAPQDQWTIPDLCPECITIWNDAANDDDDEAVKDLEMQLHNTSSGHERALIRTKIQKLRFS